MTPLRTRAGRWGAVADWIITALDGDTTALAVYALLVARYADREGVCDFPTQDQLAADLKMSISSVKRGLAHLREIGVLSSERRVSPGRGAIGAVYWLDDSHPDSRSLTGDPSDGSLVSDRPESTSYKIQRSDPDPDGGIGDATRRQQGFFEDEHRDRLQVLTDLIAEAFNNRRGQKSTRDRLARLVRAGATSVQMANAIAVTKTQTRDDPVKYAVAVLARYVEEGVDGNADVQRLAQGGSGHEGSQPHTGATRAGGLASQRARPGAAAASEYAGDF